MSASLVGSEMCIRDRARSRIPCAFRVPCQRFPAAFQRMRPEKRKRVPRQCSAQGARSKKCVPVAFQKARSS
eukprot:15359025-Alexandrium_andersonii.AAC.1